MGKDAADGAVLREVSRAVLAVTRHLSVREVLQVIADSAGALLDARYAAIGVPDDGGSFAEFVVHGISARQHAAIGPLPRQHGLLAAMLTAGAPQRLRDVRTDPRFAGWPAAHPELADLLGMPIQDGPDVLGIIFVANKRSPGGFGERDEELLGLFADHAAIALTNARLYERSRELSVIQERTRLARDLHDAVAQKLFSLRLTARAAAALAGRDSAGDPGRGLAELARVERLAAEALAELRAVIVELRPPELAEDGLVESLRRHIELLDRVHEPRLSFTATWLPQLSEEAEATVFRVAQEAVHNALRHAGAGTVSVRLAGTCDEAVLRIRDDGTGLPAPEGGVARGLGIDSMRERAAAAGGELEIHTEPGAGTTVRLRVPASWDAARGASRVASRGASRGAEPNQGAGG